jgi:Holliday junction resolvase RusA-like endonuclease
MKSEEAKLQESFELIVKLKPLSVNTCWQGRRFKTDAYKVYEKTLLWLLPKRTIPKGKLRLTIYFNFSNKASDVDNCIKPIQDILQKKYKFNDKDIYELHVYKCILPKGQDCFSFKIEIILKQQK